MSVNNLTLLGTVGTEPELITVPGDRKVLKFRLATQHTYKDSSGKKQEETTWHNIEAWNKLGELMCEFLSKGDRVFIEGMQRNVPYEGSDGFKRTKTFVTAKFFDRVTRRKVKDGEVDGNKVDYQRSDVEYFDTNDIPF